MCVVNLLEKTHVEAGDHVVLVGAGYMGLLTLQGMCSGSSAGESTVFEKRPERLAMAKKLNLTAAFAPDLPEGLYKQILIRRAVADGHGLLFRTP